MVRDHVAARGVRDPAVLQAMLAVPREAFLPPELEEFAYEDTPLPIAEGQTVSQPYIVALMTAALRLSPQERVLEIGTGSGYAAAVLSRIAREVYTIERHAELAEVAARRLEELGFRNVHVKAGDGTLGWAEHAPYDAIVVTAGGPDVPRALFDQLAAGGRLVMPVGEDRELQRLVRITRTPSGEMSTEELEDVRFVPLIGEQGWEAADSEWTGRPARAPGQTAGLARLVREAAEPISGIENQGVPSLLERIGGARVVLIGEATHGTSEFYRLRAEITKELIRKRGFTIVAVEADWPDAARVNDYAQGEAGGGGHRFETFARFPTWMWRNHEVLGFIEWLRGHNAEERDPTRKVGFHGLDLYSLFTSIRLVLDYLSKVDPQAERVARERYGCLSPWEADPATYGRAAVAGLYRTCEKEAVAMLEDMLGRQLDYAQRDGAQFFDAVLNAQLVANAERYYRAMFRGGNESWNLRDTHMFQTLEALLAIGGPRSKAVVWEHNSHLGDAAATEPGVRGQINVGHLCRREHGEQAYLIGFGTDHGTVAAAEDWDGPMQVMSVRPARSDSYEGLCHESGVAAFLLPLREPARADVREELSPPRLERAIGVVYRPETELQSHYFHASLPRQFDEYVWIDTTRAVRPVTVEEARQLPRHHPFSLREGS